jgi:hypothetical protein
MHKNLAALSLVNLRTMNIDTSQATALDVKMNDVWQFRLYPGRPVISERINSCYKCAAVETLRKSANLHVYYHHSAHYSRRITMFRSATTRIAHNSTIPSLSTFNKDLKALQELINAEKSVMQTYVRADSVVCCVA